MTQSPYEILPIGYVVSKLTSLAEAPRQGNEGAPEAWLELLPHFQVSLRGIKVGAELIVITWLHHAARDVLEVHPRDNYAAPLTGVFATRSADRPNPIGLHPVQVLELSEHKLRVAPLEAVDGTPLLDIKPVW